jgi:osmotically-inducible protein OsmY
MKKPDSEIHKAVLRELKWDTRVDETAVGVEVDDGVVTLTGTVHSWAERVAAEKAAHRVADVLDVANDVEVKLPGDSRRTDTEIAQVLRLALAWDVLVPEKRIRSTVSDGWVILEGDVDAWTQREDAERAVRNLSGVRGITNKIAIKPSTVAPQDIERAIESALARRAQREAGNLVLEVHEGRVTLSGAVGSWSEKQAVIAAVKGTHGVRSVDERLRIESRAA